MSNPTDIHPALTPDRLGIVAQIITDASHEAATRYEPKLGDNGWALGCRRYAWNCHGIVRGSSKYKEWLSIVDGGGYLEGTDTYWTALHFVFAIGGVPLRFYRGKPSGVPSNSLVIWAPEIDARQTSLFGSSSPYILGLKALRLAVEIDETGEVSRITLVQVDKEDNIVGDRWIITDRTGKVAQLIPKKEEAKDLGDARVGSRKKPEQERGKE